MKKFLGFIVAVAMVAAGIAPAMAGEAELGGEIRVRMENWSEGGGADRTTQRTRVTGKYAVDDQTSAYIELADVRTWGEDGTVTIFGKEQYLRFYIFGRKATRWKKIATIKHNGAVYSIAFSPDGKYLASGSEDKTVILKTHEMGVGGL